MYGARAEKPLQNADFAMKQTNICRLSDIINTNICRLSDIINEQLAKLSTEQSSRMS